MPITGFRATLRAAFSDVTDQIPEGRDVKDGDNDILHPGRV